MDRDPVADARDLVAQRYPGSEWALLTGSVLTPARTAGSDLDVVLCLPDGSPGHRLSLRHRGWPVGLAERWLAARHDDEALARVVREVLDGAGGPVFEGFRRESPTAG